MNKPTVLGKSPLLLACHCSAFKSVLPLNSGKVAAILPVSTVGSSHLVVLAWHRYKSEPVSLQPAQLRWLQLQFWRERPFSASLLFGRNLSFFTQIPVPTWLTMLTPTPALQPNSSEVVLRSFSLQWGYP